MKQDVNDYSILRKVHMLHTRDSAYTLGRTTSYESSQFCKSFDIMSFRRASTKEDINVEDKTALTNMQSINPSQYVNMEPLQQKVWKALLKQSIVRNPKYYKTCIYTIQVIVLNNQSEYEFKFNISSLSCFLKVRELATIVAKQYMSETKSTLLQPYLSILIGRVKTQKLDSGILLFELVNILINGQRTLILQESQF